MYDIFFLQYYEPCAKAHWDQLVKKYKRAIRIENVPTIIGAHQAAAKIAKTSYIWIVDADNIVHDSFNFSFRWPKTEGIADQVAVWRCANEINGLVYGYGGIKLLPRQKVLEVKPGIMDFTTSISGNFFIMEEIASTTIINDSTFNAWKSGFREGVKLASGQINNSISEENAQRLIQWQTNGKDNVYGDQCIRGAIDGEKYGKIFHNNIEALNEINNWEWLRQRFKNGTNFPSNN